MTIEDNALGIPADAMINTVTAQTILDNRYKYQHLWKLNQETYDPLWNVDGKTITSYDWDMNRTGEDKNVASGTDTTSNSTTTYDSATDHATDKSGTTYGRTDTRTYTNLKDKKSGTETVTRQGNIGVTMATQLAEAELNWAGKLKFLQIVADDILNAISYIW